MSKTDSSKTHNTSMAINPRRRFNYGRVFPIHKKRWLSSKELRLVILHFLKERPRHGYEIIRSIEDYTSGFYAPSPGIVYPCLAEFRRSGLAISSHNGTKNLFELTNAGRSALLQCEEAVVGILEQIKTYGEKMAYFQNQALQEEQTNERWGGGLERDDLELKAEFIKVRRTLRLAIFEKSAASVEEKKRVLETIKKAIDEIRSHPS